MNKIKPFLYYLSSECLKRKENHPRYDIDIEVSVISNDECLFQAVFKMQALEGELELEDILHQSDETLFVDPFEIHIEVVIKFYPEEDPVVEETDPIVVVSKPYRTDQCVVRLLKEPEILFLYCLHYCVCLECVETNPFRKCPSCRTQIKTKVMI